MLVNGNTLMADDRGAGIPDQAGKSSRATLESIGRDHS